MIRLIDTHAHPYFDSFDVDREEMLTRAKAEGVEKMIVVGTDLETSKKAIEFCKERPGSYPTAGWHPHDAKDYSEQGWKELERLAQDPAVVAIGESGLDHFRNLSSVSQQADVFARSIELAIAYDKPLIVHSREAGGPTLDVLREAGKGKARGVMHCFSGDWQYAKECLDLGFYLSFSAVVTYPKNEVLRDVVRQVPVDRILSETDSPFLPPQRLRGKRNEPSYMRETVEVLASRRGIAFEEMARSVWDNATALFALR